MDSASQEPASSHTQQLQNRVADSNQDQANVAFARDNSLTQMLESNEKPMTTHGQRQNMNIFQSESGQPASDVTLGTQPNVYTSHDRTAINQNHQNNIVIDQNEEDSDQNQK